MAQPTELTSWRGLVLYHPASWEVALVSGPRETGRLLFADRSCQRLDVHWRPLTYVPDMDRMLEKYRPPRKERGSTQTLDSRLSDWRGVVRKLDAGTVVHAATFFRDRRLLVEAAMVWPSRRNTELETQILSTIRPEPDDTPDRLWQAMGMSLRMDRAYELTESKAKVGAVQWTFVAEEDDAAADVTVERLAMPKYWLDEPLREWLVQQAPGAEEIDRQDPVTRNNHRGEQLISHGRINTLATIRGIHRYRLDTAWTCPIEERVYRVTCTRSSKAEDLEFPDGLKINCCRRPTAITAEASG